MIIELLGAPGTGKTTLAQMLSERMKNRQIPVELWLSYRPGEVFCGEGKTLLARRQRPGVLVRRIARPTFEMLKVASCTPAYSPDAVLYEKLIRILKPTGALRSLQLRQYIRRLSHAWLGADHASGVMLFDQGFAQAICSLALLASDESEWHIECALLVAPPANLSIRLTAGDDVVAERLRARGRHQSWIERALELDLDTSLRMARVVDTVYEALVRLGRPTISIETHDRSALDRALTLIESEVARLHQRGWSNRLNRPPSDGDSTLL